VLDGLPPIQVQARTPEELAGEVSEPVTVILVDVPF